MKVKKRIKMIPCCYKKRGPRNPSNYSLSQLLEIGSFKKRINDLKMNNRLLTNALQESRIEAAYQNNLLKDCARDTNQILFARIKLNEMAKNLAKFATDLEEVRNCLNISLPVEYNCFQKSSSNEHIIKVPDVSCIEEEPELIEDEESEELHEDPPDASGSNLEENMAPHANHDIGMTPILFLDDVQETKRKRSSSVDKGSLTPQLNIDFVCCKQKRSTRSKGKTSSLGRKRSTSRGLVTYVNAVSTPQMPHVQDPVEMSERLKSPSPLVKKRSTPRESLTNVNDVSPLQLDQTQGPVEMSKVLKSPLERERSTSREIINYVNPVSPPQISQIQDIVEMAKTLKSPSPRKRSTSRRLVTRVNVVSPPQMPQIQDPEQMSEVLKTSSLRRKRSMSLKSPIDIEKRESENLKIPFQNHSDESVHGVFCKIQSSDLILNDKESDVSNIDLNQPSEINNVFPLQPQNKGINSPFVTNIEDNPDIHRNIQEENNDIFYRRSNLQKLTDISPNTSSALNDVPLPKLHEYDEEIQNVGSLTFCDSDSDEDEKESPILPLMRSSRKKTPLKFTDFFSSDEDDIDSPFKLTVRKRCNTKKIKLNSIENADEISSDVIKDFSETDYSVYNLDVSNSKQAGKKHKKKTSAKSQNKKINEKPKPLFQKCSVVKLKGGKLKFSKCENTTEKTSVGKLSEQSFKNSCVSPGGILKRSSIMLTCEDKKHEASFSEIRSTDNMQDNKQQNIFQTPKRVSFAPTDLVCKFEKMSESKAIADNKKVRRTSKSAVDLKELFDKADQSKTPSTTSSNSPENTNVQKPSSLLFDFSGETEMYTFTFPTSIKFPVMTTDDVTTSKQSALKIADDEKVKRTSKSALDLKELFEKTSQSKSSPAATGISSENTHVQKKSSVLFDFNADTEQILISPANDTATSKPPASKISEHAKLLNNISNRCMESSPTTPNISKNTGKLSLKENDIADKAVSEYSLKTNISNEDIKKSPTALFCQKAIQKLSLKKNKIAHKTVPEYDSNIISVSDTAEKIIDILLESPMSLVKAPKRKSLFKESPDRGPKENINTDQLFTQKKDSLKNKNSSTPKVGNKKSLCSKSQSKVHSKISTKKNKKSTQETRSLEQSPVLVDATNIMVSKVESHSRRRSKQVSYKEPCLNKKLRRT